MLFEFNRFFKLQSVVKSRIHFNTSSGGRGAYIPGGYDRMYFFCLQADGSINVRDL